MSGLSDRYFKAMVAGRVDECIRIEQDADLYGYPPKVVSIGLKALDAGESAELAVHNYICGATQP